MVHFAVWLHDRGYRVVLLDCDLQHSSSQWIAEAEEGMRVLILHSEDGVIEQTPLLQQEADIVIADGPVGLKELTRGEGRDATLFSRWQGAGHDNRPS